MLAKWKVSVLKIETEKGDLARNISKKKCGKSDPTQIFRFN